MAETGSISFLQTEILKNNKIVTYRLLSRKLVIHVNSAKNELAAFYAQKRNSSQPVHATYLVSGDIRQDVERDEMDVDEGGVLSVPKTKMVLASEQELEATKSSFSRVHSCHVYALSASSQLDLNALYGVAQAVREIDISADGKFLTSVGKVVSDDVKFTSVGKPKDAPMEKAQAPVLKPAPVVQPKIEEKSVVKPPVTAVNAKPKPTGKLDWSKAKSKDVKKEPVQVKSESMSVEAHVASRTAKPTIQRGMKRKSDVLAQKKEEDSSEEEAAKKVEPLKALSQVKKESVVSDSMRVKRGVVLSDEEDDGAIIKPKTSRKPKAEFVDDILDPERSVRAIMDIDDSEVIKVTRMGPSASKKTESEVDDGDAEEQPQESQAQDVEMDEDSDPAPKAKPRKRKEKKVIPIGRNGLKKKRIMKSRMKTDEKGYMVTEDYSSYESVDEEEVAVEAEVKTKTKPKKTTAKRMSEPAPTDSEMEATGTSQEQSGSKLKGKKLTPKASQGALKSRASTGASGQKNIMSFFSGTGSKARK